jgi:hypothetical protein
MDGPPLSARRKRDKGGETVGLFATPEKAFIAVWRCWPALEVLPMETTIGGAKVAGGVWGASELEAVPLIARHPARHTFGHLSEPSRYHLGTISLPRKTLPVGISSEFGSICPEVTIICTGGHRRLT